MILTITLFLFFLFVLFHTLYIFIPLYTSTKQSKVYPTKEKGFSILIPSYNETLVIENCLNGILNVNYKELEILFINDGSTDNSLDTFDTHLMLIKTEKVKKEILNHKQVKDVYHSEKYPYIWVIDKENGGKADALNTGINFAENEIIITLDADSILEPNSLNEMNLSFSDESIVAAGGLVNIVQGFKRTDNKLIPHYKISGLIRYQVIQYLTAFYLHKTTQSKFGSITVIAGAFGAFRRSVLIQANGYRLTVGEDMDITLRIQELIGKGLKGKRIVFVPEAVCYTECPASFKNLYKQRIRWQKAFVDCIFTYTKSFYRKMNFRVSTYLLLDSLLLGTISAYPALMVPIIVIITMNNLILSLILLTMSIVLAIMQNIATLIVSRRFGHFYGFRDYISILLFLPIEVMFFRITGLFFVIIGTILYFFDKDGWSRSERIGQPILFKPNTNVNIDR
ncbi:glycosyl transferase [Paraliobacillus quinghaiensis]|uniref:Glycosyl transferase n=1 Tax=Paraliobacillus quinghaiensis TaxID=470815 RepID=A0A917TJZ7_9BACI|nr:glycosyltransferase family 2 protein [Paraliobacillus quinghaiensis]GGM23596.1 glycosyl transferase [Paraliobacillus quinghaiensis]